MNSDSTLVAQFRGLTACTMAQWAASIDELAEIYRPHLNAVTLSKLASISLPGHVSSSLGFLPAGSHSLWQDYERKAFVLTDAGLLDIQGILFQGDELSAEPRQGVRPPPTVSFWGLGRDGKLFSGIVGIKHIPSVVAQGYFYSEACLVSFKAYDSALGLVTDTTGIFARELWFKLAGFMDVIVARRSQLLQEVKGARRKIKDLEVLASCTARHYKLEL